MLRRLLLILLFSCAAPAAAVDYSDIWFIPAESGWGVNFIQNDLVIYATLFVYAENGAPTWYGGILNEDAAGKFQWQPVQRDGSFFRRANLQPGLRHEGGDAGGQHELRSQRHR